MHLTKKKTAILVLALAMCIGVASAALLQYYGKIISTVDVKQAIYLDGHLYNIPVEESFTATPGDIIWKPHYLESKANVPIKMAFDTEITNSSGLPDGDGITVTYWKILGYKFDEVIDWARVTVEDKGEAVEWTIDLDENSPNLDGNPVAGIGVVIGIGNDIKFQVHNNDGVDNNYPYGTWLYSIYNNGWRTGTGGNNQPLPEGITATGGRSKSENPQMIFTIAISKEYLDMREFKWAVFFKGGMQRGSTKYPSTFSWSDTTTVNMATATLLEQITSSFTLAPSERLDFYIKYEFATNITPDIYTITTEVQPA
jgi:hypothetical protein